MKSRCGADRLRLRATAARTVSSSTARLSFAIPPEEGIGSKREVDGGNGLCQGHGFPAGIHPGVLRGLPTVGRSGTILWR